MNEKQRIMTISALLSY